MDNPGLNQTRVFVTYLPARLASARAPARSLGAPAITVLASAIVAGGFVHAIGGAGAVAQGDARITFDAAHKAGAELSPETLPYLALASAGMARSIDPSPARLSSSPAASTMPPAETTPVAAQALNAEAPIAPRQPIARKRLDLEGFLDEQGYALTPAPTAAEGSSSPAESPVAATPDAELALAEGVIAPVAASSSPPSLPQAEAQSFPTITVDGVVLGAVTMRGDRVHLNSLLGLLELKMPATEFARLRAAPSADSFVSIETLRLAGLDLAVEPGGERLTLAAR